MSWTKFRPPLLVAAMLAACAPTGCRTAGVSDLTKPSPLLPSLVDGMSASDLLNDHNLNAEKVEGIEGEPTISVQRAKGKGSPGLGGHLVMERPKNFKLQLSGPLSGTVADIGSNTEEFWFWVKDDDQRAVFFCNYDENGGSPLPMSIQPDSIIEALGLKVVTEDEMERMTVERGDHPGEAVLSIRERTSQGKTIVREMVVSEATKRVREYKLWSGDHKQLLANATILEYGTFSVPPVESNGPASTVYLPKHMRLNWTQEQMTLDVQLRRGVTVNPKIEAKRRANLFVEPEGYARVDLAKQAGIDPQSATAELDARGTTTRDTLSAPTPKVKLSEPTPLNDRGAKRVRTDRAELAVRDPMRNLGSIEDVVAPPIPTINEPRPVNLEGQNGWRGSFSPAIER